MEAAEENPKRHLNRLKLAGVILTVLGCGVFAYFVYSVGFSEIVDGITRFGIAGFAVILILYFLRLIVRSLAWKLSVHAPYELTLKDTIPAVIIGEALSSTIPLGILISGTSKAVAVRNRIPLVAGMSSVATENLFYSLVTGIFLIAGGTILLRSFAMDDSLVVTIDVLIISVTILLALGVMMVVRQWHPASTMCEWLYRRGFFTHLLENGRRDVRRFEDLIYGFYRLYPRRFLPICIFEALYHGFGIAEGWYILSRLSEGTPGFATAFLLESVSRMITIMFKLIPFVIGVDEAGAQFVGRTVALGAGVGVTLAIIRKGRILFWTAIGFLVMIKRGLSIGDLSRQSDE